MRSSILSRLTYANVVATLALVLALAGGVAFAATQLEKNSVKSKHIKDGQVRAPDVGAAAIGAEEIGEGAVNSAKVADGSLGGADIDAASLFNDNSLSGADIDEASLQGVDAATLAGSKSCRTDGPLELTNVVSQAVPLCSSGPFTVEGYCFASGINTTATVRLTTTEDNAWFRSDFVNDPDLDVADGSVTAAQASGGAAAAVAEPGPFYAAGSADQLMGMAGARAVNGPGFELGTCKFTVVAFD